MTHFCLNFKQGKGFTCTPFDTLFRELWKWAKRHCYGLSEEIICKIVICIGEIVGSPQIYNKYTVTVINTYLRKSFSHQICNKSLCKLKKGMLSPSRSRIHIDSLIKYTRIISILFFFCLQVLVLGLHDNRLF